MFADDADGKDASIGDDVDAGVAGCRPPASEDVVCSAGNAGDDVPSTDAVAGS